MMNILIFTQKIDKDDDYFSFFLDWIREFAKRYERVTVIALWVGPYDLPKNVKVLSLGKESDRSRLKYITRFYRYIWRERHNYDQVFVHMNHEYVLLAGPLWRLWHKKIALWYTHKKVTLKLRIAHILVDDVFSASEKSFLIPSKKLHVVGHGINTDLYKCDVLQPDSHIIQILTISRIASIKNLDTFIRAIISLQKKLQKPVKGIIVSRIPPDDDQYYTMLRNLINELHVEDIITFAGAMPGYEIAKLFCKMNLTVNLCPTGGIDKVVYESMASGVPCLVSNDAYLPDFGIYKDQLFFPLRDHTELARKMESLITSTPAPLRTYLRQQIVTHHQYGQLVDRMTKIMKS